MGNCRVLALVLLAGCTALEVAKREPLIEPLKGPVDPSVYWPLETRTNLYRSERGLELHSWKNAGPEAAELSILRSHGYASRVRYESRAEGILAIVQWGKEERTEWMLPLRASAGPGKVLGTAAVEVPAGRFEGCLVVSRTASDEDGGDDRKAYLAPGVGLVREERGDTSWVLAERSPRDGPPDSPAAAVLRIKSRFPEVRNVVWSPGLGFNRGMGQSSNLDFLTRAPPWEVVFWQGWGDCESGCIYSRYSYFTVDAAGEVARVGAYGSRPNDEHTIEGEPLWGIPRVPEAVATGDPGKLLDLLRAPEWWYRRYAIGGLSVLRRPEDQLALVAALHDPRSQVRAEAAAAVTDPEPVVPLLADPDPAVVRSAIGALGKSGRAEHLARLVPFLRSGDPDLLSEAFPALTGARYEPALPALHDAIFGRRVLREEELERFGHRVYALASWGHPRSVPTLIGVLEIEDAPYEKALESNRDPNVSYFTYYSTAYGAALEGLSRASGKNVRSLAMDLTPMDRRRMVAYWRDWWKKEGARALSEYGRAMDPAELRRALRWDDPRHERALAALLEAIRSGRAQLADYAEDLAPLGIERNLSPEPLRALWKEADPAALEALVRAVEREDLPLYRVTSILEFLDTLEGWRAFLRAAPAQASMWRDVLQRAWTLAGPQGPKAAELGKDYRALLLRALDSPDPEVFAQAVPIAAMEDLTEALPRIRARRDPLLFSGEPLRLIDGAISKLSGSPPDKPGTAPTEREQGLWKFFAVRAKEAGEEERALVLEVLTESVNAQSLDLAIDLALDHGIEVPDAVIGRLLSIGSALRHLQERRADLTPARALQVLRARLRQGDSHAHSLISVIVELGRIRDPELPPFLEKLLDAPTYELREAALSVLARRYGWRPSEERLVALARRALRASAPTLEAMARDLDSPALRARLRREAAQARPGGPSNWGIYLLLEALGEQGDEGTWRALLEDALDDRFEWARERVSRNPPPGAAAFLRDRMESADDAVWKKAASLLAEADPAGAAVRVAAALDSFLADRRRAAAEVVRELRLAAAIPALRDLVRFEKDPHTRKIAMGALVAMALPELEGFFLEMEPDPFVGRAAVEGLLAIDAARHQDRLLGLLARAGEVSEFALRQIGGRRMTSAAPRVLAFLKAHALGGEAMTEWERLNASPDLKGRVTSGTVVGERGGVGAAVTSFPGYHSMKAAIDALARIGDRDATPTLRAIAEKDPQGLGREALRAWIALAPEVEWEELLSKVEAQGDGAREFLSPLFERDAGLGEGAVIRLLPKGGDRLAGQARDVVRMRDLSLTRGAEFVALLQRSDLPPHVREPLIPLLERAQPPLAPKDIAATVRAEPQAGVALRILEGLKSGAVAAELKDWLLDLRGRKPGGLWSEAQVIQQLARTGDEDVLRELEKSAGQAELIGLATYQPRRLADFLERDPRSKVPGFMPEYALNLAVRSREPRLVAWVARQDGPRVTPTNHAQVGYALIAAAELKLPEFREEMERLLASRDGRERMLGRELLLHYDPDRLLRFLRSTRPSMPANLFAGELTRLAVGLRNPEVVPLLLDLQDDVAVEETRWILEALGRLRDPRGEELALRWMRRHGMEWHALDWVVPCLLRIDARKHVGLLKPWLRIGQDADKKLQVIAGTCGPEAIPFLVEASRGWRPEFARKATSTIENLRKKRD